MFEEGYVAKGRVVISEMIRQSHWSEGEGVCKDLDMKDFWIAKPRF